MTLSHITLQFLNKRNWESKILEELNEELASDAKALIASIEKGEEDTPEFYEEGFETFDNSFGVTSILMGSYGI